MHEVEVKISVGKCTVAGLTSGELKKMSLITKWEADEFNEKLLKARNGTEKKSILNRKADAISKLYYRHIGRCVVSHNFKFTGDIGEFLAGLSEDDVNKIEVAVNEASGITPDEASDLSKPSGTKGNPKTEK